LCSSFAIEPQNSCEDIKQSLHKSATETLSLIDSIKKCSKPSESYRNKVFSNLRYRNDRLKICVIMVYEGKFGFDCSREFRKTLRANGGENCENELHKIKIIFNKFEEHSLRLKLCEEK
jgi:hypothetical protein